MKQVIIITMIGLLFLGSSCGQAESENFSDNPFGLEVPTFGDCVQMESERTKSHYWYTCNSMPREHPDIEVVLMKFMDDVGICWMEAISFERKNVEETEAFVDRLKDEIARKYGPPTNQVKETLPKYLPTEKRYVLPGESEKLKHNYEWRQDEGFKGVGNVSGIRLKKDSSLRARIIFKFFAADACQKKLDEKRASAF